MGGTRLHVPASSTSGVRYRQLRQLSDDGLRRLLTMAATIADCAGAAIATIDPATGTLSHCASHGETDLGGSVLLSFALLCERPTEIENLSTDDRFRWVPEVAGPPGLRWMLAVKLAAHDGLLGALLLVDRRARKLDDRARSLLDDLSAHLSDQLAQRLALEGLRARHAEQLERLARLEGVLDAARFLLIVETDRLGVIRFATRSVEQRLGHAARHLVGKASPTLFHVDPEIDALVRRARDAGDHAATPFDALVKAAREAPVEQRRFTYQTRSGETFPVLLAAAPVHDEEGVLSGHVLVAQDITEQRELEQQRNELLAMISHDLRTPLTSLRGALRLLSSGHVGELDEEARECISIAALNTERLVSLVGDITHIEEAERGLIALDLTACDPAALLRDAMLANTPLAAQHGVALELNAPPPCPLVDTDPPRIGRVLTNLISNAVRFSPSPGVVTLSVEPSGRWVRFSVRDRGPGIPLELRSRVFQRFFRGPGPRPRESPGRGLGLSIVQQLVELHGGAAGFTTAPGDTTFHFDLPVATQVG